MSKNNTKIKSYFLKCCFSLKWNKGSYTDHFNYQLPDFEKVQILTKLTQLIGLCWLYTIYLSKCK